MTLKQIIEKCGRLDIFEQRCDDENYKEFVIEKKDLGRLNSVFAECLGSAVKPPDRKPSKKDLLMVKEYGGIFQGQTLFSKEFERETIIIMLWPWKDDSHITIKMAILKSGESRR